MFLRYKWQLATAGRLVAAGLVPETASADPMLLSVNVDTSLQQTMNRPCVIGDPSCTDALAYTLIGPHEFRHAELADVHRPADSGSRRRRHVFGGRGSESGPRA